MLPSSDLNFGTVLVLVGAIGRTTLIMLVAPALDDEMPFDMLDLTDSGCVVSDIVFVFGFP